MPWRAHYSDSRGAVPALSSAASATVVDTLSNSNGSVSNSNGSGRGVLPREILRQVDPEAVFDPQTLAVSYRAHHRLLWGLCYRMTGSTADADDLLQDTFARALQQPPRRGGELRPWLVRVAMNLARDLLRRRRRRGYVGCWLPTPTELDADGWSTPSASGAAPVDSGEARYQLAESASYAFLVALEALTPQQRAVLLLRDVLDYSVRETAAALSIGEANVKTTLHRARRSMRAYETLAPLRVNVRTEQQQQAIEAFLVALVNQDAAAVAAMLAKDVRALSDGGGHYFAAKIPVVGAQRVARFYLKITAMRGTVEQISFRMLNGQAALITHFSHGHPGEAPWVINLFDIDDRGRILCAYAVLAPDKVRPLVNGP